MDELLYKLNMDPLQLRIINHSDKNEHAFCFAFQDDSTCSSCESRCFGFHNDHRFDTFERVRNFAFSQGCLAIC